jgi:hypothetical protein
VHGYLPRKPKGGAIHVCVAAPALWSTSHTQVWSSQYSVGRKVLESQDLRAPDCDATLVAFAHRPPSPMRVPYRCDYGSWSSQPIWSLRPPRQRKERMEVFVTGVSRIAARPFGEVRDFTYAGGADRLVLVLTNEIQVVDVSTATTVASFPVTLPGGSGFCFISFPIVHVTPDGSMAYIAQSCAGRPIVAYDLAPRCRSRAFGRVGQRALLRRRAPIAARPSAVRLRYRSARRRSRHSPCVLSPSTMGVTGCSPGVAQWGRWGFAPPKIATANVCGSISTR